MQKGAVKNKWTRLAALQQLEADKKMETKKGWMQTSASKKWRSSDETVLKMGKVGAATKGKTEEKEPEDDEEESEEDDEDEDDTAGLDKKKPRSSIVMGRLADKIKSLEDATKKKREPKEKKRKTEEDPDEDGEKEKKKKVTVEELKERLKAVREMQKKENEEEKETLKK